MILQNRILSYRLNADEFYITSVVAFAQDFYDRLPYQNWLKCL